MSPPFFLSSFFFISRVSFSFPFFPTLYLFPLPPCMDAFFSFRLILLYFHRDLVLHFFVFFSSFSFQHYLSLLFFFYLASFKIILYFLSVYLSFTVFFNNFSLNLPSPKSYLSFLLTPSFQASLTFKLFLLLLSPTNSFYFKLPACSPSLHPIFPPSFTVFLPACCVSFFAQFFLCFFYTFFFFFLLVLPIYSLFCPSDCLLPNYKSSIF